MNIYEDWLRRNQPETLKQIKAEAMSADALEQAVRFVLEAFPKISLADNLREELPRKGERGLYEDCLFCTDITVQVPQSEPITKTVPFNRREIRGELVRRLRLLADQLA